MKHEEIHEETSRAWDIVAQAKYDAELEEHLQLLRSLGHTLLPVEIEAVQPYLTGAKVVHLLDSLWERDTDSLQLRQDVGYFDSEPRENPGFPASVVEQELGENRPRLLERQWRPDQVIACLLAAGLRLESYQEHPLLFWDQFPQWPKQLQARLPHCYSIMAVREEGKRG